VLRQKKKKAECELDMAPMIDMVFLLLIFFMCSATMQNLSTPEELELPEVKNFGKREGEEAFCALTILSDESCLINGRKVDFEEAKKELENFAKTTPKGTVLLRIDRRSKSAVTKRFVKLCGEAGLAKIIFSVYEES
jgi:biopolymer transport protein ExbD